MSYFHHNKIIIGGLRCSLCCYACSYTYIEAAASSRVCVCVWGSGYITEHFLLLGL